MLTNLILSEDSRTLAANVRGIGMAPQEIPEWKKHVTGGKKSSFGKKTDMTLIQQRQSLPIYKLREDLIKVITYSSFKIFQNFVCNIDFLIRIGGQ